MIFGYLHQLIPPLPGPTKTCASPNHVQLRFNESSGLGHFKGDICGVKPHGLGRHLQCGWQTGQNPDVILVAYLGKPIGFKLSGKEIRKQKGNDLQNNRGDISLVLDIFRKLVQCLSCI